MTGADHFQLILDKTGRAKNGIGNIVRTHICIEGLISEEKINSQILTNKAVLFLHKLKPIKKWYSAKYNWTETPNDNKLITYHACENASSLLTSLLHKDYDLNAGSPLHINVIYESERNTHFIISVNHALLDFNGMELLLKSISTDKVELSLNKKINYPGSFLKKFIAAVQVTFFVAAKSSWSIQHIRESKKNPDPLFHSIIVEDNDWLESNKLLKGLPLYLACTTKALAQQENILHRQGLSFFIPTPIDRRSSDSKNTLLSNQISFLFFKISPEQITDIENTRKIFLNQIINQAKLNIPGKFEHLLNLFSYLPEFIYKAFIDLPSNGKSSSFAFSSLPNSFLASGTFMNHKVLDYTHFPPFLSPPGLNIIFMEMKGAIKIIANFDGNRIDPKEAKLLLQNIKNYLTLN